MTVGVEHEYTPMVTQAEVILWIDGQKHIHRALFFRIHGEPSFFFEVTNETEHGPTIVTVKLLPLASLRTQISTRSPLSTLIRLAFTPRPEMGRFYQRNVLGANLGDSFQHGLK